MLIYLSKTLTFLPLPLFFYYFKRILRTSYVPTNEDILLVRQATSGVHEMCLSFVGRIFTFVDDGGQRSERKKWINCLDDASSILFIASLSAFNKNLIEVLTVNRLGESIPLFETVVKYVFSRKLSKLLFLNKEDIFDEKIRCVDLKEYFEDFNGMTCCSYIFYPNENDE